MFGPGAYRPDPTEGMTTIAALPPPELVPSSRPYQRQACPRCDHQASRDKQSQRTLHDLGNLDVWCPRDLGVTYAQHSCTKCHKDCNADLSALAPPGSQYTHRVIDWAGRLVVAEGLPSHPARWHLGRDHRVFVPFATIQHWSEAGGKKAQARLDTDVLDGALADVSGAVAAAAWADGPFCLLSAVDQRCDKRIRSEGLDHAPTHDDIRAFLRRLHTSLQARNLTLLGVTTDGASLSPEPLAAVFDAVPPQVCEFQVVKAG